MIQRLVLVLFAGAMFLLLSSSSAMAEDEIIYQKHQVVHFGDDTIDGNLSRPDGQYLESRKRLKHRRLIKVRQNFRPEILQSVRVL